MISYCSAPAKLMIAGEYAVLEGGTALLLAVNRRAEAHIASRPQHLSPFLAAVVEEIELACGADSAEANRARRVTVDTRGFREGPHKLGLGSSAAATVAATGVALFDSSEPRRPCKEVIHRLAHRAHQQAQGRKGVRGSGVDVATCVYGGSLAVTAHCQGTEPPEVTPWTYPPGVHWVFPFTGRSASTVSLVGAIQRFGVQDPKQYGADFQRIREASTLVLQAQTAKELVCAVKVAGDAVRALGEHANTPLWRPEHSQMENIARVSGGAAKPSGAGGGDLAVVCFPEADAAADFLCEMKRLEIVCPNLGVDKRGVHLHCAE